VVFEDTPMAKIHFLFTMLNISLLTVIKKGNIVGLITRHEFLKKRKGGNGGLQMVYQPPRGEGAHS